MRRVTARRVEIMLTGLLLQATVLASADHIQVPSYQNMETIESRTVTTNPFSGMLLYRLEDKGSLAVAYRICFGQEEGFPFAIADFAGDTLYLDRDRDGHVDEKVAPAHLQKRSLTEDLPACRQKPDTP